VIADNRTHAHQYTRQGWGTRTTGEASHRLRRHHELPVNRRRSPQSRRAAEPRERQSPSRKATTFQRVSRGRIANMGSDQKISHAEDDQSLTSPRLVTFAPRFAGVASALVVRLVVMDAAERDAWVAELWAEGFSTRMIARRVGISRSRVQQITAALVIEGEDAFA
jgi:Homeodomain-like domain